MILKATLIEAMIQGIRDQLGDELEAIEIKDERSFWVITTGHKFHIVTLEQGA
jgi:hypothetical protein